MRNFWLEADVDGRETKVSCGPRSNDGEMCIKLYQKDKGQSVLVLEIDCYPNAGGTLTTRVINKTTGKAEVIDTER